MKAVHYTLVTILSFLFTFVQAQQGCSEAAGCVNNVKGTDCSSTDFGCLCKSDTYIDNYNNCVYTNCPAKYDQDVSFLAMVQICGIFKVAVTAAPEASLSSVASAGAASNFPTNVSSISAISNPLQGPPHHSTLSAPITGGSSFPSGSFTEGSSFPTNTGSATGSGGSSIQSTPSPTATSSAGGSSASPSATGSNVGASVTIQWTMLGGLVAIIATLL